MLINRSDPVAPVAAVKGNLINLAIFVSVSVSVSVSVWLRFIQSSLFYYIKSFLPGFVLDLSPLFPPSTTLSYFFIGE